MSEPAFAEQFEAAATEFFPEVTSVTPIDESRSIAKVETPTGIFALRKWPKTATTERIRFVHAVLASLKELPYTPTLVEANGQTTVRIGQDVFDAVTWLEGKPIRRPEIRSELAMPVSLPRAISTELVEELSAGVARMHVLSSSLVGKRSTPVLAQTALTASVRDEWSRHRGRLRPIAHLTPDIQRWLRTGERALPLAERILGGHSDESSSAAVIVHGNISTAHILVQREGASDRLSGVIDFKQVVAATPLVDLAQIAAHFNGWSDETAEIVIGAYGEVNRLTPADRRVLPAFAALDLIVETGRVLNATYVELGSSSAPESMRGASDTLLRSLESATRTMERLEGINQPGPQKWVHRPPKPGQPPKGARPKKPRSSA